jgi:hypothetical protein
MDDPEEGKSFSHTTSRLLRVDQKNDDSTDINYWESSLTIPAKPAWSWGCASAVDSRGRTIFVIDAQSTADSAMHETSRLVSLRGVFAKT